MIQLSAKWVILIICLVITGCSTFKEMQEDASKTESAIESEWEGQVEIGWLIENGKVTLVEVVFVRVPSDKIDLALLKRSVTELVNKNFRRKIQEIKISF